jgi:hypothetical protein
VGGVRVDWGGGEGAGGGWPLPRMQLDGESSKTLSGDAEKL